MEKEGEKNPSFLEMVLGWRRAFWNSITKTPEKDHHHHRRHHHHQTPPSAENANPTPKIQSMFGLLSNPSTPNHGSEPVSAGLREGSAQTEKTPAIEKDEPQNTPRGHSTNSSGTNSFQSGTSNNNASTPPAATAQIVGWPPVRSYKKNTSATTSKNNDEVDGKPGSDALFVKVSMDGAPYLKKVDLRSYNCYQELSSALEKMFATSFSTLDQCGLNSNGASGKEMLSDESKLKDLLQGKEYVLAYEDKNGDWMFVGDVPWETFIGACKRLKIMKSSDAIGLAPRVIEKSKNRA